MYKKLNRSQTLETPRPSREELAYLAGFFDGEGCIYATRRSDARHNAQLLIMVSGAHFGSIERFQKAFGGNLINKKWSLKQSHWLPVLEWRLSATPLVLATLRELLPFLVVKRSQAEIAMDWPLLEFHGAGTRLTEEQLATRERIAAALKSLKKEAA